MNIRPLRDKIAVKLIERTKSNTLEVIMKEKPNTGTVIAVGAEAAKHLQPGDSVPSASTRQTAE